MVTNIIKSPRDLSEICEFLQANGFRSNCLIANYSDGRSYTLMNTHIQSTDAIITIIDQWYEIGININIGDMVTIINDSSISVYKPAPELTINTKTMDVYNIDKWTPKYSIITYKKQLSDNKSAPWYNITIAESIKNVLIDQLGHENFNNPSSDRDKWAVNLINEIHSYILKTDDSVFAKFAKTLPYLICKIDFVINDVLYTVSISLNDITTQRPFRDDLRFQLIDSSKDNQCPDATNMTFIDIYKCIGKIVN